MNTFSLFTVYGDVLVCVAAILNLRSTQSAQLAKLPFPSLQISFPNAGNKECIWLLESCDRKWKYKTFKIT